MTVRRAVLAPSGVANNARKTSADRKSDVNLRRTNQGAVMTDGKQTIPHVMYLVGRSHLRPCQGSLRAHGSDERCLKPCKYVEVAQTRYIALDGESRWQGLGAARPHHGIV